MVGLRLASGGLDTDIVVMDIVSEAGKCRLTGHSGPITDVCFYENEQMLDSNIMISSSKDKQIKLWNVSTECCFKTLVDYSTEIWGIALLRGGDFLAAGCADSNITIYRLTPTDETTVNQVAPAGAVEDEVDDSTTFSPITCSMVGTIKRAGGRGRICNLISDQSGKVLAFHGTNDKMIELFVVYSKEEAQQRCKKRLKKNAETDVEVTNVSLTDEIRRLPTIDVKTKSKLKSIDIVIGNESNVRLAATFANNTMRVYALNIGQKKPEAELLKTLQSQGHPSEVRALSFTSDSLAIASADGDSLKLWNRESLRSTRTINGTGYVLCCCFTPGDRYCLLGTIEGKLVIADIVTGEVVESIEAHQKELWSMALYPTLGGVVTGGGDATVKFWSFELIDTVQPEDDGEGNQIALQDRETRKVLSLMHRNTLKLEETVQCVAISANSKFVAVGQLDSTVKIFFMDTLKFYLALYGHKLSILCMDISDDSSLIATGSADRNVKIWGMDFGDCHRSLFAHDDSVMALKFVPKTHMFWTCGKDGKIKQWDADSFVQIQTVSGHLGQAYNLAVSSGAGHYLVTCGSDRVLRLFERSQEPIVLQDQQEMEREEREKQELATGDNETTVPGIAQPLRLPSRKTVAAEQGVELLLDALDISGKEKDREAGDPVPLLMQAYQATTTADLLLAVLSRIRATDLEETLLLLPFTSVCELLKAMPDLIVKRTDQTELISKVVLFLFRIHRKPIVANHTLLPILQPMIANLDRTLNEQRDIIGKNLHALQLVQNDVIQRDLANSAELFYDATKAKKLKDRRNKKRQLLKRISIQMI